jgi:hypothetical protein
MNEDFSKTVHKKGFTRAFGGVQPTLSLGLAESGVWKILSK